MLDKMTSAVLDIVNAGTDGAYKVMETADLLALLPPRLNADETGLANALRFLSERGYIDIKYSDRGTYCLCSLPKGRTYAENAAAETAERKAKGKFVLLFFGAFAGALAGSLIVGLVFLFCFA